MERTCEVVRLIARSDPHHDPLAWLPLHIEDPVRNAGHETADLLRRPTQKLSCDIRSGALTRQRFDVLQLGHQRTAQCEDRQNVSSDLKNPCNARILAFAGAPAGCNLKALW
jgi:hypothetical protein